VHRSPFDWQKAEARTEDDSPASRVFFGLLRLSQVRHNHLAFTRSETEIVDTGNEHVLAYFRQHQEQSVLVLANFTESPQPLDASRLRQLGLRRTLTDLVAGRLVIASERLMLEPYQFMVLATTRPA
jgi:amylosucrase/maltose alpha-D-glucosyltransferase/alpha-amylase